MYQAYGVLGFPLGHSLSPLLHNQAFQMLAMNRSYFTWEITTGDLDHFMRAVRILPLSGVSVTIPHKENVISFLDGISPEAKEIGAVNTIFWQDGRLMGTNTDYLGFMAPIRELDLSSALVLGSGGASRSVLYGLKKLGVQRITLCSRSPEKARNLAEIFGAEHIPWPARNNHQADILVNTTPLGTLGENEDKNPWDYGHLPFKAVYDLVYNPLRTRLIRQAKGQGIITVSGLSMFVHQAREQFRIWTGEVFDPVWAREMLGHHLSHGAF